MSAAAGGFLATARKRAGLGTIGAAPFLITLLMAGPVALGLGFAVAPAFGWLPAVGAETFSIGPWRRLFEYPGVLRSVCLSLAAGLISAFVSVLAVTLFLAAGPTTRLFRAVRATISPLLSVPHAAAALGVAFMIAPSGWIARALSPWATGWERPPDLLIVGDPLGLAMIFGLVLKEIPFLLLIALAALPQVDAGRRLRAARALGYGPTTAFLKAVAPSLYGYLRLPIYAVIAYAASSVEVALVLGPTQPPPLAVLILRWMNDPDLSMRLTASAGALLQLGVVLVALAIWRLGERLVWRVVRLWAVDGRRRALDGALAALGTALVGGAALMLALGLLGLALSSVAGFWRFPDVVPDALTLRHWSRAADGLLDRLAVTAVIAGLSAGVSLALVVAALEARWRSGRANGGADWLLYAPLLAPQVSFLFGLAVGAETLGLAPTLQLVAATHVVFVLPYVYLSLAAAYQRFDPAWDKAARSLGQSPSRVFWRVRAPMLLGPGLTALAVGVAVSIGQYLPTQLMGAGRVATVTTEAVALAAGGDRRVIGVWALAQALLPMIGFWVALMVPRWAWRRRRGMRDAG